MKGHLHERDIPQVRSRCPNECVYVYTHRSRERNSYKVVYLSMVDVA